MVRTSGIREKLRSNVLRELAKERGTKRTKQDDNDQEDKLDQNDDSPSNIADDRSSQERKMKRAKEAKSSLLSLLPEPKHSSSFGPTIRLDKLLKMHDRVDNVDLQANQEDSNSNTINRDGMIEVDVSRVMGDGTLTTAAATTTSAIRDLTIEKTQPGVVVVPRGKEKQKNQITYLAKLGQATELERKEQAAQGRLNKSAARSKYGW